MIGFGWNNWDETIKSTGGVRVWVHPHNDEWYSFEAHPSVATTNLRPGILVGDELLIGKA